MSTRSNDGEAEDTKGKLFLPFPQTIQCFERVMHVDSKGSPNLRGLFHFSNKVYNEYRKALEKWAARELLRVEKDTLRNF